MLVAGLALRGTVCSQRDQTHQPEGRDELCESNGTG
jgi:hypothetical protein